MNFIDISSLKDIPNFSETISFEILSILFKKPHYQYTYYDEEFTWWKSTSIGEHNMCCMMWLSSNLVEGIAGFYNYSEDIAGDVQVFSFKIVKRGKNGRQLICHGIDDSKVFLKHYDNLVAEIIILELDETSTESKE